MKINCDSLRWNVSVEMRDAKVVLVTGNRGQRLQRYFDMSVVHRNEEMLGKHEQKLADSNRVKVGMCGIFHDVKLQKTHILEYLLARRFKPKANYEI
ncbi:hypothetical protein PUN28_011714 [Cardiocondyla obscurior]|uniref:Uncharacterized protein n=1 Tax=Cardiocondyla obscurior TaxID=286306 RepID=A0AAW2FFI1_9HYME